MKKSLLIFIMALLMGSGLWAQCPPGGIDLLSQADVNQFAIDYPNCTMLNGDLKIEGNSITNLMPLSGLSSVNGNLDIRETGLSSLNGLQNLNSIIGGYLKINSNSALATLNGLNSLSQVDGYLEVYNCSMLTSLSGLDQVTAVGSHLIISSNSSLSTLNGLNSLNSIGGTLDLQSNFALASISALSNLSTITGDVNIILNIPLSVCNYAWLCNIINDPKVSVGGNSTGCDTKTEIVNSCASTVMAVCKDANVMLGANGQASIQASDVDNNSFGATSATVSPSAFSCSNLGPNTVTLTVMNASGNTDQCTSTVTVSTGTGLPGGGGGWQGGAIGQAPTQPVLNFSACSSGSNTPAGQFTIGGSGNNATSMTTDNITFAYQTLCGTNSSITVKVETVSMNGYGGLMMRESSMAGAKQVAVFSNLTNSLRHETRYTNNSPKVVQNFMKPNPIWLRLKRMGTWVFAEYSFNGVTFQPVHAVIVPMQNCVQVGMAAFSFTPGQQATATFSNVTTTGTVVPIAIEEGPAQEAKLTEESLFLSEEHTENTVSLFPNPARTLVNLKFEKPTAETTRITILNQLGQRSSTFMLPKGVEQEVLDVQGLAAGMYMLRVENDQLNETIPFIITQ